MNKELSFSLSDFILGLFWAFVLLAGFFLHDPQSSNKVYKGINEYLLNNTGF